MAGNMRAPETGDRDMVSLGGEGENGRNCFLLKTSGGHVLLDCGVKRDVTAGLLDAYPALDRQTVQQLDAVFLSHAHEDHCAALPMLSAMGYRGVVYASRETISSARPMIRKWMRHVQETGGRLPYGEEDAEGLRFAELPLGLSQLSGLTVLTGRSGHTVGSYWFAFQWGDSGGWQVFYSGDMCFSSRLLDYDVPPPCRAAIIDSAYADEVLDQEAQYGRLEEVIQNTLRNHGRLLLPVPARGRGSDLLLYCAQSHPGTQIWAEAGVFQPCIDLLNQPLWLRKNAPSKEVLSSVRLVGTADERARAVRQNAGLFFAADGMLTTAEGRYYLEHFGRQHRDGVLLTGHAAKGTPASDLQAEEYRSANGIRLQVSHVTIKVHLDQRDVLQLCRELGADRVMLFHAEKEKCSALKSILGG